MILSPLAFLEELDNRSHEGDGEKGEVDKEAEDEQDYHGGSEDAGCLGGERLPEEVEAQHEADNAHQTGGIDESGSG